MSEELGRPNPTTLEKRAIIEKKMDILKLDAAFNDGIDKMTNQLIEEDMGLSLKTLCRIADITIEYVFEHLIEGREGAWYRRARETMKLDQIKEFFGRGVKNLKLNFKEKDILNNLKDIKNYAKEKIGIVLWVKYYGKVGREPVRGDMFNDED